MRRTIGTLLVAGTLALGGCDSDDDGGSSGDMNGGTNPGEPGGMGGTPPVSGDVFALAARMDGDDAAPLDRATLQGQLDTLLGDGDSAEPLAIEDGDTVLDVLRRQRDANR